MTRLLKFLVLAASPLGVYAGETVMYPYDPCQHEQEYMIRGKLVAEREISNGKLHRFVYFGDGVTGTTAKQVRRAEVEAAVLNRMGITTTIEAASDTINCTFSPYRRGYQEAMEAAIEKKFGKSYRAEVERKVTTARRSLANQMPNPSVKGTGLRPAPYVER